MTDKRDLLLTLVFLKFIGERFKDQQDKIRKDFIENGIDDEGFIELQLKRPQHYMQDGVFFLSDETFWDKLILTPATGMAIAFDTAIKLLDDNEPKLKNALPQQIFTKTEPYCPLFLKNKSLLCEEVLSYLFLLYYKNPSTWGTNRKNPPAWGTNYSTH